MILKKIKLLILQIPFVRIRFYRKRYKISNQTKLNYCYINAPKGNPLSTDNTIIGEPKSSGANPVRINIKHSGKLTLKEASFLRGGCKIFINGKGSVIIGKKSYVNWDSTVATGGNAKIEIGDNCAIAWNTSIIAYDFHVFNDQNYSDDILIGNNVWIGANVTILKGTKIGDGCVVAANSLIKGGDFPKNSLIVGAPAKVVKNDISWRNLTRNEKMAIEL